MPDTVPNAVSQFIRVLSPHVSVSAVVLAGLSFGMFVFAAILSAGR